MPFERENIHRLAPYVPGEQPTFRQTAATGGVVKLNTNENPYPPSPKVLEAIRSLAPEALRLYPPPDAPWFRDAAAEVHEVDREQVVATNGGDELLRLLVTVFGMPGVGGGGIGVTSPSYSLYGVLAAIHDTPVTSVPRGRGFELPERLAEIWNEAGCRLGLVVNPHAPSGRLEAADTLAAIARVFKGVLVVDEAYVDFAPGDALGLVRGRDALPNVVILRSLSKGYGLAGLRFGYGIGAPGLVAALNKARDSYNTDIVSQVAATAAIRDQAYARDTWDRVRAERSRLTDQLRRRRFEVVDSHSNFVLARPTGGRDAAVATYRHLKAQGMLVRYFDAPGLDDRLRITVGTPEQDAAVLAAIDGMVSDPAV